MSEASGETGSFIQVSGRMLHIRRLRPELEGAPLVFLHEGLGSVELWRGFPDDVTWASGHPGLVYSRYGNGWSTPLSGSRGPEYMHQEALETLPEVLETIPGGPPILIGHSDGASIALIYAGAGHPVAGLVLIAPHVFVEPETVESIASIRDEFRTSDMVSKMAKYHTEPETTFRGWADVWLSRAFLQWNIEEFVAGVRCPTLLIQGDEDEYGTLAQLDAIDAHLDSPAERLVLAGAGHSPHLSHPRQVTVRVVEFLSSLVP